jgi:hypothetical protein
MDKRMDYVQCMELLRGEGFNAESPSPEPENRADVYGDSQKNAIGGGKVGVAESNASSDEEREKKLEQWMQNIKTFIRGIDVNSL